MKVLFVDDEPDLAELAKLFLKKQSSKLVIETANSAIEGLKKIKNSEFDAVISDYDMPKMDGLEFFEALKEEGKELFFIVFTGSGRDGLKEEAEEMGVDGYLRKGGNPKEKFSKLAETVMKNGKKSET